jgi:heat shock protein HslJ
MRTILLILSVSFTSFYFIACNGDEQQNGTDQNAPNTLESLLNPSANSATAPATAVSAGSNSLQDIWVLAMINSEQKYDVNFVNNTPVLDLDSAKRSMSGHTGCNSISGKLKVQGNKLLFDSVRLTSSQPCNDKGFEKKLVSGLKGGNTTYKIANDTLYLSLTGAQLIYRRIRRGT